MFEKSPTWIRINGEPDKAIRIHLGYVPDLEEDPGRERRAMRWAVVGAIVVHLVLFLVRVSYEPERPEWKGRAVQVFQVKQLEFKRPDAVPQRAMPKPKKSAKRIPIPDPTPDDPEPIRLEEVDIPVPDFDVSDIAIDSFFIPDGPPGVLPAGGPPMRVGGDVTPPIRISGETPHYTEEARQGRVQGVVILEAIIDNRGDVVDVKVLKGLPLGLSDNAVIAARDWKFKPAMRGSEPVPVYYNLTVRFSLQ